MKLLSYIFPLAYFLTISPSLAGQSAESRIVAIVNDKSILTSDLNHRINLVLKTSQENVTPEMKKKLQHDILQQMIEETLQQQVMDQYEITIDGPELESAMGMMEQRMGLAKGKLIDFLKTNNIPLKLVQDQVRSAIGWQHYIQERYGKDVQVTDVEVKAEMAKLQKSKEKNQALLSEIVLSYEKPEQAEETKRKAEELSSKIRSGAAFPLIAQQYSHSASAGRGGDIGWVSLDEMEPEVKKVVESTRRGEVSGPIPVKGGYRIVGVRDRHGVGSIGESTEYVSFQQIEFTYPMFGGEEGVQETHHTAQTIREKARTCSMMKKMAQRPRINLKTVDRVPVESMHPELVKMLKKLKPGDRSELMNTGEGLIMFMVCEKDLVKPHEPDEKDMKNMLREKKMSSIYDRELRSLKRVAFIEIR